MSSSQLSMFQESLERVINVSSVPKLSLFRYPGGKTWLVPRVRTWMMSLPKRPSQFIEPFAGGGITGLSVAAENLADHVTLVELDDQIAAVWKTVLGQNWRWFASRITEFDLTYDSARAVIDRIPRSSRELAFQTILKNRVYHGGILAQGSGMLKHGENGKGIHSRWYPETLSRRIHGIAALKKKITFVEGDGLAVISENLHRPDVVFFVDPPYTAGGKRAGKRLYRHCDVDHDELFRLLASAAGECLLTYDDAPEVRGLASRHGFQMRLVAMQNTHHAKMKELLIGKDLSWLGR